MPGLVSRFLLPRLPRPPFRFRAHVILPGRVRDWHPFAGVEEKARGGCGGEGEWRSGCQGFIVRDEISRCQFFRTVWSFGMEGVMGWWFGRADYRARGGNKKREVLKC